MNRLIALAALICLLLCGCGLSDYADPVVDPDATVQQDGVTDS